MKNCIFCKISNGELPATKIYENSNVLAFHDTFPMATIHILVIPKKHIKSLKQIDKYSHLINEINLAIPKIAEIAGLANGFKMLVNTGKAGGQKIDHLHYHILGGNLKNDLLDH